MSQPADASSHIAFLDRYYGRHRRTYDLTRRMFLLGRERMLRQLAVQPGERVLEIGCGTARNLLWLARREAAATYHGVDASREMLKTAADRVRSSPADVVLSQHRAESLTSPDILGVPQGFDVVFFSYSLSMMPDWRGALAAAMSCLCPTGRLSIVDFWDLAGWPKCISLWTRRRLLMHHVRFDAGVHEWLREAQGPARQLQIAPVARRWAYLATLRPATPLHTK
ncbi:MAG: class I SAM-dependent methyltransferase [Planctomycetes bacterium]|nr:class I SAM-dependent methyltransferase [Planctomycetota bacterium]